MRRLAGVALPSVRSYSRDTAQHTDTQNAATRATDFGEWSEESTRVGSDVTTSHAMSKGLHGPPQTPLARFSQSASSVASTAFPSFLHLPTLTPANNNIAAVLRRMQPRWRGCNPDGSDIVASYTTPPCRPSQSPLGGSGCASGISTRRHHSRLGPVRNDAAEAT